MITSRLSSESTKPPKPGSPLLNYAVEDGPRAWIILIVIAVLFGGAAYLFAAEPTGPRYHVTKLPSLGGMNSGGNSINDETSVAGYSDPGDGNRHAALWRFGSVLDLKTLGGPNSSVIWSNKNTRGIIAGISQTNKVQPRGELWSQQAFFSGVNATTYVCLGFVWKEGQGMMPLRTLGGDNGVATGANNRGLVVGWAENTCVDRTCVPPQVLQFRPVYWNTDNNNKIHELPLGFGDTSGAATAINDSNDIVGISGICDQAVGRYSAKHAVLWQDGKIIKLGDLGAKWWNTPTAINQRGDVVGFAGDPNYPDGDILHGFIWTKEQGIQPLGALPGRTPAHVQSQAYGINERRQVVGISCDADSVDCRAFLWENGVMKDLNDPTVSDTTVFLDRAKDINDRGEITGRTINPSTGERTAYLAEPIH